MLKEPIKASKIRIKQFAGPDMVSANVELEEWLRKAGKNTFVLDIIYQALVSRNGSMHGPASVTVIYFEK